MNPSDARHRLGFEVLGPIFDAFGRLLLRSAERDRITRLAFISRDGWFLKTVTGELIRRLQPPSPPDLTYVHLSRISTSLPPQKELDERAFEEVRGIRVGNLDLRTFLAYYALDSAAFTGLLARHRIDPGMPLDDFAAIRPLLDDPDFQKRVAIDRQSQTELLQSYLRQETIGERGTALVDIGWRGSIAHALLETFPAIGPIRSYYFGYWHELGCTPAADSIVEGILADYQRGRGLSEGAAFYLTFLFEALCRADEGTVVRYRRADNGTVVPVLLENAAQREAEKRDLQNAEPIRKGILDFIAASVPNASRLRIDAQQRLRRLAFFPTREEIAAVEALSHTEGHASDWSRPLVQNERPSPLRSPRAWLAGLSSPWRSAYVMATGGRPLAFLHMAAVSVLLAVPPHLRLRLRKVLLAIARMR